MRHLLAVFVGVPVLWHLAIVAGTVYDAGRTGMSRWKWGTIALVVPLFGAFAYLLERSGHIFSEAAERRMRALTFAWLASVWNGE